MLVTMQVQIHYSGKIVRKGAGGSFEQQTGVSPLLVIYFRASKRDVTDN